MLAGYRKSASTHHEVDCHERVEENTLTVVDGMMSPIMLALAKRRSIGLLELTVCQRALPRLWCHRRLSFFTKDPSSSMLQVRFSRHFSFGN
jgi:hypothetical protein